MTCCIHNMHKVLILLSIITCVLSMLPHLFVLGIIMAYSNFKITPQLSMVIWPLHYMIRVYIVCKAASIATNEVSTRSYSYSIIYNSCIIAFIYAYTENKIYLFYADFVNGVCFVSSIHCCIHQAVRTKTILNAAFHKRLTDDEKNRVEYSHYYYFDYYYSLVAV